MLDDVLRDISEDETLKMFMHAGEVQPPSSVITHATVERI